MASPRTNDEINEAINEARTIAAGSRREFPMLLLQACLTRDGDFAVLDALALNVAILVLAIADMSEISTDAILKEAQDVDVSGYLLFNDLACDAAVKMAQSRIARNPVNASIRGHVPAVEVAGALICIHVQAQILHFKYLKDEKDRRHE